MFSFSKCSFSF